jgi:hypothetical protein
LDKIILAHFQDLATNQTGIAHPADNAKRKDQFIEAGSKESHHGNRQEQAREGQKHVEDVAGYDSIEPSSVVTCQRAQQRTDYSRDGNDDNSYLQRDSRSKDYAGEYVSAGGIGSEEVLRGRREITKRKICSPYIVGRDPGSQYRNEHEDNNDAKANDG